MQFEFPLISIGEIDGHVYLLRDGEKIEAANVSLELSHAETGELATILRSEYDGYFYLPNVIPGKYQLRVEPHLIKRLSLHAPAAFDIEIHDEGDSITTPDIVLKKLEKPSSIEPLAKRNNHENN
ncbi:MAG: carboxypeptidase regulatory-like domain-containing protein [Gammaproteobacteria bacterium]|nr:carboxypeptidase regulatory-like domain-containing protein [Gammaproteobacteria bacterium]